MSAQIKLIRNSAAGINDPDDPTLKFKVVATYRPTGLPKAFPRLPGKFDGEEIIVVRASSREVLDEFISAQGLKTRPGFHSMTITGPKGLVF